jgi:hypothetical protein
VPFLPWGLLPGRCIGLKTLLLLRDDCLEVQEAQISAAPRSVHIGISLGFRVNKVINAIYINIFCIKLKEIKGKRARFLQLVVLIQNKLFPVYLSQTAVEIHVRYSSVVFPSKRWETKGTVQVLHGRLIKFENGYMHIVNLIECAFVFI